MLTVLQSCREWLPLTCLWLYDQIRFLPGSIENHVLCDDVKDPDRFPVAHRHAYRIERPVPRLEQALVERLTGRRWVGRSVAAYKRRRRTEYQVAIGRRVSAQLIHSHFGHFAWGDLDAARILGIPQVVTFYGLDVGMIPKRSPTWRARYRELFARASLFLCEGPFMADCLVALGCPREKVEVHPLGSDLTTLEFRPRTWTPGEPLRVLMAASFREKKGLPYALAALGQIKHQVPIEITLIGDASAGEERTQVEKEKILRAIRDHGLSVRQLGYQPHARMIEEARAHHVFLSPSVVAEDGDSEGGAPVSIIEMAALGIPVVSTTHCDIPNVIPHGRAGLLAPERDVASLAQHLLWLTEHPERWRPMVEEARRHVEREFDARLQGERLGARYRGLIERAAKTVSRLANEEVSART